MKQCTQPVRQLLLKAAGAVQVKRQTAIEERDRANLEALRDREDLAQITRELFPALMNETERLSCLQRPGLDTDQSSGVPSTRSLQS